MKRAPALLSLLLLSAPAIALAQPAPAPMPAPAPAPEPRRGFTIAMDAGYAYRRLYSIPIHAGEVELSFGGALKSVSIYGTIGGLFGRTEQGLLVTRITSGPSLLFPVTEKFRLGVAIRTSTVAVQRVTAGDTMGAFGFGFFGNATYDVITVDPVAFYVGARVGGETFMNSKPNAWLWGGSLNLGFRY